MFKPNIKFKIEYPCSLFQFDKYLLRVWAKNHTFLRFFWHHSSSSLITSILRCFLRYWCFLLYWWKMLTLRFFEKNQSKNHDTLMPFFRKKKTEKNSGKINGKYRWQIDLFVIFSNLTKFGHQIVKKYHKNLTTDKLTIFCLFFSLKVTLLSLNSESFV